MTEKLPGEGQPAGGGEHKKGKRRSTTEQHQRGVARKRKDREREKADRRRRRPRKKPRKWKGKWPPVKKPQKPAEHRALDQRRQSDEPERQPDGSAIAEEAESGTDEDRTDHG